MKFIITISTSISIIITLFTLVLADYGTRVDSWGLFGDWKETKRSALPQRERDRKSEIINKIWFPLNGEGSQQYNKQHCESQHFIYSFIHTHTQHHECLLAPTLTPVGHTMQKKVCCLSLSFFFCVSQRAVRIDKCFCFWAHL